MLTDADKAIRATGIGASEAWKVVGEMQELPDGSQALQRPHIHDVFLRLCHPELYVDEPNVAMRKGNALEDLVAELYAERTGFDLERSPTLRHAKHPFVLASPDRLIVGQQRGLEIKAPTIRTLEDWGPDGSQEFPLKYRIQCTQQMAVKGYRAWDLCMLHPFDDAIRIYPVPWDEDLAALIIEQEARFWRDHVVTKDPPPVTGSKAAESFLAKRYPRNEGTLRAPTGDAIHLLETGEVLDGDIGLAKALGEVKAQQKTLKARALLLTNVAKARTGVADGVEGLWTWRLPSKGKGRTAWAKVVAEAKVARELIAKHTKPASRAFRLANDIDDEDEET